MALTQPILNSIAAFDATQEHIFSFISIGGDQVLGSQLTIYDNETGAQVYQGNYTSFKFEYPLAAGTLTNGKYYNATISTINNASEFSEPSNPVAFYCYTAPVLTITNIPASGTIEQSNYTFQGSYVQAEGELLNGYQYTLYDSNKEQISQSAILYDGLYQHTFSGMANDTSYYVELSGSTINNTPVSSGLLLFTIRYIQPASFAICDLVNNCENGFIQISSNIVSIDGKSEPDPPKYIDNKEVDLTDDENWVQWDEGFNMQNDFTMRIWGRSFGDNEPIVTMKNELDTNNSPNRIEMRFMATNIVDTLPNYISAMGNIITTENAVSEPITDLNICGNSYQKVVQASSESIRFESDNGSINNANPKLGAELDIEGNSKQETRSGKNKADINNYYYDTISYSDLNISLNNGEFTISTDGAKNLTEYIRIPIKINSNGTYTFGIDLKTNKAGDTAQALVYDYTNKKVIGKVFTNTDINYITKTQQITIDDSIDKDNILIFLYCPYDGTVGQAYSFSYKNIFFNEGTNTEYEPYGAMPSPEFPSPIRNVGDNVNIFDMDTAILKQYNPNGVLQSTNRYIKEGNKTKMTYSVYQYGRYFFDKQKLQKGTYTYSFDVYLSNDATNLEGVYSIRNFTNSTDIKPLTIITLSNNKKKFSISFEIKEEAEVSISLQPEDNNSKILYIENLKLEQGLIATPYSPYNCGNVNITVCNENLVNPDTNENGYIGSNGTLIKATNNLCSDFIPVSLNNEYILSGYDDLFNKYTLNYGVAYYDENKTFLSRNSAVLYGTSFTITDAKVRFVRAWQGVPTGSIVSYLQLKKGSIAPTEYTPHQSQVINFPLAEGQKLMQGDYLADDGIHHKRKQTILGDITFFTTATIFGVECQFAYYSLPNAKKVGRSYDFMSDRISPANETFGQYKAYRNDTGLYVITTADDTVENFNSKISGSIVEYELAEEEIVPYTTEQQTAYNQLQNLNLYEDINNFSFESGLYPISTLTYNIVKASPAPNNPSEVHFTGDIGNQIDFPDTSVSYTDGLHVAAKPNNNYILLPNRIYTLNFDYVVTNSTTDIYYGIGYGTKDNYVGVLTINGEENIQYATQNKGSNSITFQTPATFEGVDTPYLWIDFAKTIITATVAVNVSNVSLYFGKYTLYQKYGRYNVPFKILGQNLFNYQKLLYFIDNNTNHEVISNGYSVNPTVQDGDCYALIGYTNNFIAGDKYTLSYQTLGNLQSFNLYSIKKGTSEIVSEIALIENVFVAPDNNYDLMLKFTIDSSDLSNNLNLWNIQITKGEKLLDYATYTENGLNMDFEQPLRSIGKIKDCILLDTVNLLDPTTLRANVKENTTYYFSSSTSNSYLLEFYNIEDNLIDTEDISSGAFTTPANCVYVTSKNFTTLNVIPEQIQIEEGNTFSQYFPYITQPSVIRNVGRIIVNGTEDWTKNETVTASNAFYLRNSLVPSYKQNATGICTHYKTISDISSAEGIFYGAAINICTALSYNYTVSTFKTWLAEQNSNGNPVIIYYQLSAPQVYNLSGDYATTLRNFTTQIGTNSILIDSQYPGYLRLKYSNSYTEQETKANYVLLKCWNENTIPYMIHSNYITVKSPKDKIFIWTRKKNNIFDLKIENLGEE